ncbi:MAG: selenium-binding protein SBP56-related protein [Geminicoccaceae bacterium]
MAPQLVGKVRIGIVAKAAHRRPGQPLNGGPQMVEVSRDERRVYATRSTVRSIRNSTAGAWMAGW